MSLESYIENQAIRDFAGKVLKFLEDPSFGLKGDRLVYAKALFRLIASDPNGYRKNGYQQSCYIINHKHKDPKNPRSKLISCEGTWDREKFLEYKRAHKEEIKNLNLIAHNKSAS